MAVPAEPPLRAELEAAGATVHVVPMRRISTSHAVLGWVAYVAAWPVSVLRLSRLARRVPVDLLHTNSLHSWYGWAVAALTRRPHVWHAREIVVQSALALRLERRLTRRATAVIAVSRAVAAQLDPANVVVVHESVDAAVFTPTRAGRARAGLGIPDDAQVVSAVGRIDTWKGIDVLLDAWGAVSEERPGSHLVVVGGAVLGKEAYAAELEARARSLARVHWTGPRDDIPDLLADSDLTVVPSTEPEPYGLVAVEALASGVPVVATDAGGIREIVEHSRPGAGALVAPGDPDALAAAIVASLRTTGPSSTAARSARPVLRSPQPDPTTEILRGALDSRGA